MYKILEEKYTKKIGTPITDHQQMSIWMSIDLWNQSLEGVPVTN
jgi:hypothetical protein